MGHTADSACSGAEGPCCPQPCTGGQSRTRGGHGICHAVLPSHSHCPLKPLLLFSSPSGSALAPGAGTQLGTLSTACAHGTGTNTGVAPGWVSHPCQESQRQIRCPGDGHPPSREPRLRVSDRKLAYNRTVFTVRAICTEFLQGMVPLGTEPFQRAGSACLEALKFSKTVCGPGVPAPA